MHPDKHTRNSVDLEHSGELHTSTSGDEGDEPISHHVMETPIRDQTKPAIEDANANRIETRALLPEPPNKEVTTKTPSPETPGRTIQSHTIKKIQATSSNSNT
ncbi:hypothetical protein CCR75_009261 [Bremia lactucae]|uniref:Uncharacterized protein n=1 Tax=Bremia lactucae TaxID=4779 RepID=A0A976FHB7_BRELC|nr:hypothetical protein CCR75_009261 [Bremia lactucae]